MYPETTQIINTRIQNNWTETAIHWDGYGKEGELPVQPGEPFIRPTIHWTTSNGHVGGMGKYSGIGYLLVEIYIKDGEGRLAADRQAQELTDLFNGFSSGALIFNDSPGPPSRVGGDADYYHINVQFNFEYNECRG